MNEPGGEVTTAGTELSLCPGAPGEQQHRMQAALVPGKDGKSRRPLQEMLCYGLVAEHEDFGVLGDRFHRTDTRELDDATDKW